MLDEYKYIKFNLIIYYRIFPWLIIRCFQMICCLLSYSQCITLVKFMVKILINEICHTCKRNVQPIIYLSLALDTWIKLTIQVPIRDFSKKKKSAYQFFGRIMAHFTTSPLFQLSECCSSLNVIPPTFSGDISNSPTWISIQFPEGLLLKFSRRVRVFECGRMMVRVSESFPLSYLSFIFTTNTTSQTVRSERFIV